MIYFAGYQGRKLSELVQAADALSAVVVDIRFMPYSPRPEWRQKAMQDALCNVRNRYYHEKALGNVNYKDRDKPMQLLDVYRGMEMLKEFHRYDDVIVLCACKNFDTCHRSLVAAELDTAGIPWQHMDWDAGKAKPLVLEMMEG